MADKARLTQALDDCIRALQELKRIWEETDTEGTAPAAQAAVPPVAPPMTAAPEMQTPPPMPAPPEMPDRPVPQDQPAPAFSNIRVVPSTPPTPFVDTTDRPMQIPTNCSKCGAALTPGAKFCLTCGTPVGGAVGMTPPPGPVPGKFCSKCGAPVDSGAKFCLTCGSPVQ